jgi:hypothetical protein
VEVAETAEEERQKKLRSRQQGRPNSQKIESQGSDQRDVTMVGFLMAGGALILLGYLAANTILALAGIGFAIWGAVMLYISRVPYVKVEAVVPSLVGQGQVIGQLLGPMGSGLEGVHLPPRSIGEVSQEKVLIRKTAFASSSPPSGVGDKDLLLPAPGLDLMKYFQEKSNSDFFGVDFVFLQVKLPELLIRDLELVTDAEVTKNGDLITIRATGSKFYQLCSSMASSAESELTLACPLHSSFAIMIARSFGKPVVMTSEARDAETGNITADYRILDGEYLSVPS